MKGFIEVTNTYTQKDGKDKFGRDIFTDMILTESIAINDIVRFRGRLIAVKTEDGNKNTHIKVKESYEEIKQLIRDALQESDKDFLDKCAIAAMSQSIHSKFLTKSNIIMISKESYLLAEEMLKARKEVSNG